MSRILYSGTKNASSWAMRAWLALREQEIPFEEYVVDIRRPQRLENLARIAEFSAPAAVPVLVDEGVVIFDSLAIMEYASELGPHALLPADIRLRAHTRSLLAWVHSGLSGLCSSISFESSFYPEPGVLTEAEAKEAKRIFAVWEQELANSGGPYLAGELSLADLAFVPVVRRLLSRQPDLASWPLTMAWSARLMARPSVVEWMQVAEALPPVISDE
ncbi:MAG: glutathione S-transferase family protein [Burkholderiales bacterium]|nr:glutathione S-transferase family protein [Burkholderiales bacterium]